MIVIKIIILIILGIACLISLHSDKEFIIRNRKHRILEIKKNNGEVKYHIQQQNKIFKTWHQAENIERDHYSSTKIEKLIYSTKEHASKILQEKIDEYYKTLETEEGDKIASKKVIAVTEIIK